MHKLFHYLFILLFASQLYAQSTTNENRISSLLPNMQHPLSIEPALPADFVMGSLEEEPNVNEGVIWGKKEDLEKLKKNPDRIESVFIMAKLSTNVFQFNENEFTGEENFIKELKQMGFKNITLEKLKWGVYPVLSLQVMSPENSKVYVAWVGLNSTDNKVMLFNFLYPSRQKEPTEEQLKIWTDFLSKTSPLPEKELQ